MSISREGSRQTPAAEGAVRGHYITSEDELAEVYAIKHGHDWAHRHGHGWLRWNTGWTPDQHDYLIGSLMKFGRYNWGRKTDDGWKPDPKAGGSRRVATGAETKLRSAAPGRRLGHGPAPARDTRRPSPALGYWSPPGPNQSRPDHADYGCGASEQKRD